MTFKVRKAIGEVVPKGGDDGAEDVEHALQIFVDNIIFKTRGTRIIIHIADAPCHGDKYHESNVSDNHKDWSNNIPRLLNNIANNLQCFYWFVKVTDHTNKMIAEFNKILAENCELDGLNRVTEIDVRNLKGNLTDRIKNLMRETVLQSTKIANSRPN